MIDDYGTNVREEIRNLKQDLHDYHSEVKAIGAGLNKLGEGLERMASVMKESNILAQSQLENFRYAVPFRLVVLMLGSTLISIGIGRELDIILKAIPYVIK